MTEDRDDLIVLIDEDGEESEYEHIDTIEMDGNEYVILLPAGEEEEPDEQDAEEVVILKVEEDEEGEDAFISIEDEEELNRVFEEFKLRMQDEYDFEDQ